VGDIKSIIGLYLLNMKTRVRRQLDIIFVSSDFISVQFHLSLQVNSFSEVFFTNIGITLKCVVTHVADCFSTIEQLNIEYLTRVIVTTLTA